MIEVTFLWECRPLAGLSNIGVGPTFFLAQQAREQTWNLRRRRVKALSRVTKLPRTFQETLDGR